MRNLYLTLFLLFVLSQLSAQDCVINLPENAEWVGTTKHPVGEYHGKNESVTITKTGENEFEVSDIAGGTYRLFNTGKDIAATITMDCGGIGQTTFETEFGPFTIHGGSWDKDTQTLTIRWSNPFNKLTDRVSVITIKK